MALAGEQDPPIVVGDGGTTNVPRQTRLFSPRVLDTGFVCGLILASICLVAACAYLFLFEFDADAIVKSAAMGKVAPQPMLLDQVQLALEVHLYDAHILLLSCGIFVGLAFGFIGFSLFLVGAQGNVDANVNAPNNLSLSVARLSPGLFTILCASILVGLCATPDLGVTLKAGGWRSEAPADSVAGHSPAPTAAGGAPVELGGAGHPTSSEYGGLGASPVFKDKPDTAPQASAQKGK
jgi:hypothetical protein